MGQTIAFHRDKQTLGDSPQMRIMFVRHGLSLNNYLRKQNTMGLHRSASGCTLTTSPYQIDSPFTVVGFHQAEAIGAGFAREIPDIDLSEIYSSGMRRAVETALAMGKGANGVRTGAAANPSIVALPFCSELGSTMLAAQPNVRQFTEAIRMSDGCSLNTTAWPPETWREAATMVGSYGPSAREFKEKALPWLHRRMVARGKADQTCCIVTHGLYLRVFLGSLGWIPNTGAVYATYDSATGAIYDVRPVPMVAQQHTVFRDKVLKLTDTRDLQRELMGVCDPDGRFKYTTFSPSRVPVTTQAMPQVL